jgi:hypothetical protein
MNRPHRFSLPHVGLGGPSRRIRVVLCSQGLDAASRDVGSRNDALKDRASKSRDSTEDSDTPVSGLQCCGDTAYLVRCVLAGQRRSGH